MQFKHRHPDNIKNYTIKQLIGLIVQHNATVSEKPVPGQRTIFFEHKKYDPDRPKTVHAAKSYYWKLCLDNRLIEPAKPKFLDKFLKRK